MSSLQYGPAAAALLGLIVSGNALADDGGWHVSGALGHARVTEPYAGVRDNETAYKLGGGYTFRNGLGIDTAWVDLGTAGPTRTSVRGVAMALSWEVPLTESFSVSARAGGYAWEAHARPDPAGPTLKNSSLNPMFGAGARMQLREGLSATAGIERFRMDDGRANLFSVGLRYSF